MAFTRPSIKNIVGNLRSDSLFWSAFRALDFLLARPASKSLAMPLHGPKTIEHLGYFVWNIDPQVSRFKTRFIQLPVDTGAPNNCFL